MDKFLSKSKRLLDVEEETSSSGSKCRSRNASTPKSVLNVELEPPPKKKRMCRYREEYTVEFPFIKPSRKGENSVFCEHCGSDINISSGGRDDISRHIKSVKHSESVKSNASSSKLANFFPGSGDQSVIRAEVLFTKFLIDNNLQLSVSDKFNKLASTIFPDSVIAKKFQCARTKATAITNTLAQDSMVALADTLKKNVFSLSTDGSNKGDLKLYPIVVRCLDEAKGSIETKLLCLPELKSSSSSENIKDLIVTQLQKFKIPLSNCIAFSADNCNVMLGKHGGVSTLLKKEIKDLIVIGCPCHLINLCAKKASRILPAKIDEILVDVYFFFKHSEKRLLELSQFQALYNDEVKKILKHCPTRWLSLSPCLKRLIELWQPLYRYISSLVEKEAEKSKKRKEKQKKQTVQDAIISSWFREEDVGAAETEDQNSRLRRLHSFLGSRRNLIYCAFILRIIPSFERANVILQTESPMIVQSRKVLLGLYREILVRFVKAPVIKTSDDITKVDYATESNQLGDKDLDLGSFASELIERVNSKSRAEIYQNVRGFFTKALDYMKANFPLQSEVLLHASKLDLTKREEWEFSSVNFFCSKFTVLGVTDIDVLRDEFRLFQSFNFPPAIEKEKRMDRQITMLSQLRSDIDNTVMFKNLCKVLLAVHCIPHSNADSERIFSIVRKNLTETRARMSTQTLESLMVNKLNETSDNPNLGEDILKKCKRATREHLQNSSSSHSQDH